jgi:hypothetical protein
VQMTIPPKNSGSVRLGKVGYGEARFGPVWQCLVGLGKARSKPSSEGFFLSASN